MGNSAAFADQNPEFGPAVASWESSADWQPRPLALPATSEKRDRWSPPAPLVAPVEKSVTEVLTPPPMPLTPAEIRKQRFAQKRAAARLSDQRSEQNAGQQPLPPSDRIDIGSRKSQLAETAVEQLRLANWATKRGAIASAQAAASLTLRTIATLRDTQEGNNLHTEQINDCFVAIRESTDFAGRYGPVDTGAIERLIEVHKTPVLKQVATEHITSSRAVEAYLQFAKTRLVEATQGGPLAAEAAMILSDIESLIAEGAVEPPTETSRLHASALALTYRRAAVEIAPDNADAAAKLGRTLLRRSIPSAAKDLLLQSVQADPTRQRVESLLEAAALSGDFVLVDQCEKQLAAAQLRSELPIKVMSPQAFARTTQPMPNSVASDTVSGSSTSPQYRVGSRPAHSKSPSNPGTSQGSRGDRIVDPTLPDPSTANWSNGRLLW